jgi:hypothetical protein
MPTASTSANEPPTTRPVTLIAPSPSGRIDTASARPPESFVATRALKTLPLRLEERTRVACFQAPPARKPRLPLGPRPVKRRSERLIPSPGCRKERCHGEPVVFTVRGPDLIPAAEAPAVNPKKAHPAVAANRSVPLNLVRQYLRHSTRPD